MANQQFNVVAKIVGYTTRKDANGVEKVVLSGLASNTDMDLSGERMADTAIEAMAKSLIGNKVALNNEHDHQWDADFGEVTKLWVNDQHELMMEAEADPDHYRTQTLTRALDKGKQLGLSIGGYVNKAEYEFFEPAGKKVMTYKDISLYHVAITGTPAVPATWVTPITKSVKDIKDATMPTNTDAVIKNDETTNVEVTVEQETQPEAIPATEPEAPTDPQPTEEQDAPVAPVEDHPETPTEPDAPAAPEQDEEATPDGDDATKSAAAEAEAQLHAVEKTLTERTSEVETLQKSLTGATERVTELEKSITEKDAALATAQEAIEKAAKDLEAKDKELEAVNARKAQIFEKFPEVKKSVDATDEKTQLAEGNKLFANFIVGGSK